MRKMKADHFTHSDLPVLIGIDTGEPITLFRSLADAENAAMESGLKTWAVVQDDHGNYLVAAIDDEEGDFFYIQAPLKGVER